MSKIEYFNEDCMTGMARYPDKYFDLAIVDPPYGVGDKFKGGKTGKMNFNQIVNKGWDFAPNKNYFDGLKRISKNQIIWGGNYFNLPPTRCFITWDKIISEDFTLSMAEFAWTSFDRLAKIFRMSVPKDGDRIHPTQKPVALYRWLLTNYAKPGDLILDTHVGSASSLIACYDLGFDAVGFELDEDYYKASSKRLKDFMAQERIDIPSVTVEQMVLGGAADAKN